MSDQYDLYGGIPPHERDSATSRLAAGDIVPHGGRLQAVVLGAIRNRGEIGATDRELESILGLRHETVSARRRELELKGLIRKVGRRPTPSGRLADVWRVP